MTDSPASRGGVRECPTSRFGPCESILEDMLLRSLIPGFAIVMVLAGAWPGGGGASVATPPPPSAVNLASASATLDRLIETDLTRRGLKPGPLVGDEVFLRRTFLTVLGRIPTSEEIREFLNDRAPGARERLIDRLQAAPGRVPHDLGWWTDLLRVSMRLGDRYPGHAYLDWLRSAVTENRPYDRVVRELLTASGEALAEGNGRTGFYLRDAGMPLDHLSATVQAFLGTRISCAQCHDHPFDVWTRKQFHSLAAYTANTRIDRDPPPALRRMAKDEPPEVRQTLRNISNSVFLQVKAPTSTNLLLPADYQYEDAKPKSPVIATPLYGTAPTPAKGQDPREAFATWVTADNPRFTTTIVNRMWQRTFGRGLIEPVDNLTDQSAAENPALLQALEQVMRQVGYDLVRFQAVLLRTRAWQREAVVLAPGAVWAGEAPVRQRLSAEAWWDSLMTLTVQDLDLRIGERAEPLYRFYQDHRKDSAEDLLKLAQNLQDLRKQARELQKRVQDINDRLAKASPEEAKTLRKTRRDLEVERDDLRQRSEPTRNLTKRASTEGRDRLLRAAELPQPAPPDHPLRVLGQSDRELINNGNLEPTIPQALWLMNGLVDKDLTRASGVLAGLLKAQADDDARIAALWWAILTRAPTEGERAEARRLLAAAKTTGVGAKDLNAGWKDLIWVLVNHLEFRIMP